MAGRRKVLIELGLVVALVGAGQLARQPQLLVLAIPLLVHLTVGLIWSGREWRPQLEVVRRLSAQRLLVGEELGVEVRVRNRGRGLDLVVVEDPLPAGWEVVDGSPKEVGRLPPGESLFLHYRVRPRRGVHQLPGVRLRLQTPLGFTTWEGELACPGELVVLPRWERLRGLSIKPPRTLVAAGTARANRGGVGTEFFGVREYLPGDEPRRINWKALARWDRLAVNLYQEERAAEVMVVLDVRTPAYGHEGLLEHAVRAAASLVHCLLREGHRVGLLLYGRYLAWQLPGMGKKQQEKLLRLLAQARLGITHAFSRLHHLPTRFFPPGSQIALVSPLLPGDEEWIGHAHARGYAVLLVIPDPIAFQRELLPPTPESELAGRILSLERRAVLRRLVGAGIQVVEWDVREPLAPQLAAALGRWR
jgi:uncharacterized protein (DUF58 family)